MEAIELKSITKTFGTFKANDNVHLTVKKASIHGVVGENGAGKSTLMNVLYGLYQPDHGEIWIHGNKYSFKGTHDAIDVGIGMVHQHFMLVPTLKNFENFVLGEAPFLINEEEIKKEFREISESFGFNLDPDALTSSLSVGQMQRLEIMKVLYRKADILILDEPTAVLTPQETESLFKILKSMKEAGKTILIITHKLKEVLNITDEVTVLRMGKNSGSALTKDLTKEKLASMIVGREVLLRVEKIKTSVGRPLLEIKNVKYGPKLHLDFQVRAGEILGIAGVAGNGQSELAKIIAGQITQDSGSVLFNGIDFSSLSIRDRKKDGLSVIPENRHAEGIVMDMTLEENAILGFHWNFNFLFQDSIHEYTKGLIEKFDIRPKNPTAKISELSGGNQQKLVVGRELAHQPKFLLACEPTRGVDISAIETIHRYLEEMKAAGLGILLISSEIDEILALSDRILVMYEGKIQGDATHLPIEKIGILMAGGKI